MNNIASDRSLSTDKLASAAQIIFGHAIRDHIPAQVSKHQPREEWRLTTEKREEGFAQRHAKTADRLSIGAKQLPPLVCGDMVAIQDQTHPSKPGRCTKTGTVI